MVFYVGLLIPGRTEIRFVVCKIILRTIDLLYHGEYRQFVFPLFLNSQSGSGGLSARKPFFAF